MKPNFIHQVSDHIYFYSLDDIEMMSRERRMKRLVLAACHFLGDSITAKGLYSILKANTRLEKSAVRTTLWRLRRDWYIIPWGPGYSGIYKPQPIGEKSYFDSLGPLVEESIRRNADPLGAEILKSLSTTGKYPDSLPYTPNEVEEEDEPMKDPEDNLLESLTYFEHIPSDLKPLLERPWQAFAKALFYLATLEYLHEETLPTKRFNALIGGSFSTVRARMDFMLKNNHIRRVTPTMSYIVKGQGRKPTNLSLKPEGKEAIEALRTIHDRFEHDREYHHYYNSLKSYLHANIPSDKALSFNALEPVSKSPELQELDSHNAA